MGIPQVRIFPHNTDEEFRSEDLLAIWLHSALRARGGVYHIRSADRVKDLPRGSIVLFRYGQKLVGEAVVSEEKEVFPGGLKDKTVSGESAEYTGQITFCPSSIRLYAPPVALDKIKPYTDKDLSYAEAYTILDWDIYSRILEEVVRIGTFIS